MKQCRTLSILMVAAVLAGGFSLTACKKGLTPAQEKQLHEARVEQYATLQRAAQEMQNEWGAAIVDIKVFQIDAGFIEMRKRDSYDAPGKQIAVQFCKIVGDVLPAGSIRVQVYDEAHKSLVGIAYCYDHSGRASALIKARQVE